VALPRATTLTPAVILVVEDDPFLRIVAFDMIEKAGFAAIEAEDADEALSILEQRADIRIVFTDIDMPGSMDGMKLAACVRDRWPPIRIILTSGHRRPEMDDLPSGSLFFPKPYNDYAVLEAMRGFAG
jgi:CheY-like chemotaxis protein